MFETEKWYSMVEVRKILNITDYQWKKRRGDLKQWLKNFYDYELIEAKPARILFHKEYKDYQPLPNKSKKTKKVKTQDYENFIKKSIPKDSWKLTSKVEESRHAIEEFGYEKYGHESPESVARYYIGPAMESTCIKSEKTIWVNYKNYKPLTEEQLKDWKSILSKNKIGEKEAANAFYRQSEGEDISKEIGFYKKSLRDFKAKYQFSPILVYEWRQS